MSRAPYVLLPPSESKEPGGTDLVAPGLFDDALEVPRAEVRRALADLLETASLDELSKVLKVRGPLLERALDASRRLVEETAPRLPAWQRYQGVVWSHLDPATLSDSHRRRILVPSGVYGLSSGTDFIADFRLTMKVGLADLGNLATFWRPHVTTHLANLAGVTFVDLLPKEHAAAIGVDERLSSRVVRVAFLRHSGEGVAGHDAKAVKGVVARQILLEGVESLDDFRWRGWRGRVTHGHYEVRAPRDGAGTQ